ncbi:MAG: hypothetical protein HOV78_26310, partial [Hamadaea sp.]|nr:hypothetical protein [Hamadaea sp.]
YIVAEDAVAPTAHEVRAHVRGRLPAYMVPRHVMPLTELPLTANGKVDSRGLPAVVVDGPGAHDADHPPADAPVPETEDLIRGIWRDVLSETEIDDDADFFELGGNSLMVTRVHTRLQDLFGVTLPLGEMFDATTVRLQTALVTDAVVAEVGQLSDDDVAALLREGGDDLAGNFGDDVAETFGENDERQ